MMRRAIYSLWLLFVTAGAAAAQYDTTSLSAHGAWRVEHVHDNNDGNMWCAAYTDNGRGQTFAITTYQNEDVALFVFDANWSLAHRAVRFRIDIDYESWDVGGTAYGIGVAVPLNGNSEAGQFLEQLQNGQAVAVYNESGLRLATFSLRGSSRALDSLGECWARILPNRDPFGMSSLPNDPFIAKRLNIDYIEL